MNAFVKLGIGAVLLGVGFVVSIQAQRELVAKWQCEDCDDDVPSLDEEIKSFVEEAEAKAEMEKDQ